MKRFIAGLSLLAANLTLKAQEPVTVFNNYHENLPVEHIYLHLDKQAYVPGETIWFKAYIYSPGIANRLSTNLHAELLSEKGEIVQSLKLPVLEGRSISNQFEIPANSAQGVYIIRAWTNYTWYSDATYAFKKTITVFNGSASSLAENVPGKPGYVFEWFPGSGK